MTRIVVLWAALLAAGPALAEGETAPAASPGTNLQARAAPATAEDAAPSVPAGDKKLLGISILGNQDAPKALVLVPWKSSALGEAQGLSQGLDDGRQPIDRDVFMRELSYYQIREGNGPEGTP